MQAAESTLRSQANRGAIRSAAVYYLLFIVLGVFFLFVPQTLIADRDARATARNILASETMFRLALVFGFVSAVLYIFAARALARLLGGVNERQASLMVVLVLLSVPLLFLTGLDYLAALTLFHGGPALSGLASSQRDALAMFFLRFGDETFNVDLIFSGLWLLPLASLVLKSGFVPRIVGYLLIVAGCSYLVAFLNFLLAPPFAGILSTLTSIGYQGELSVVIWLLVTAARRRTSGGHGEPRSS